jgi:hypothetical protein
MAIQSKSGCGWAGGGPISGLELLPDEFVKELRVGVRTDPKEWACLIGVVSRVATGAGIGAGDEDSAGELKDWDTPGTGDSLFDAAVGLLLAPPLLLLEEDEDGDFKGNAWMEQRPTEGPKSTTQ